MTVIGIDHERLRRTLELSAGLAKAVLDAELQHGGLLDRSTLRAAQMLVGDLATYGDWGIDPAQMIADKDDEVRAASIRQSSLFGEDDS
jgi:hypothetical protein